MILVKIFGLQISYLEIGILRIVHGGLHDQLYNYRAYHVHHS